jgi:hypothetical protein
LVRWLAAAAAMLGSAAAVQLYAQAQQPLLCGALQERKWNRKLQTTVSKSTPLL